MGVKFFLPHQGCKRDSGCLRPDCVTFGPKRNSNKILAGTAFHGTSYYPSH